MKDILSSIKSAVKSSIIDLKKHEGNPWHIYDNVHVPTKTITGVARAIVDANLDVNHINLTYNPPKRTLGYAKLWHDKRMEIQIRGWMPQYRQMFISLHEIAHLYHWLLDDRRDKLLEEGVADFTAMAIWALIGGDCYYRPNYIAKLTLFKGVFGINEDNRIDYNLIADTALEVIPMIMKARRFD